MFSKDKEATERRSSGAPSILSAGMQVTGDIVSDGEVQIDGELSGDIHCAKLYNRRNRAYHWVRRGR